MSETFSSGTMETNKQTNKQTIVHLQTGISDAKSLFLWLMQKNGDASDSITSVLVHLHRVRIDRAMTQ